MVRTVHEIPGHGAARSAVRAAGGQPLTLAEERALLLEQVTVQGQRRAGGDRRWPVACFVSCRLWSATSARKSCVRLRTRSGCSLPTSRARTSPGWSGSMCGCAQPPRYSTRQPLLMTQDSITQLAAATRDLLAQLERHLAAEEQVLAAALRPGAAPGVRAGPDSTNGIRSPRGRWSTWTCCLPGQVADAAVDRLLRLRRGEQVELRSSRDPWPVWQRMNDLYPGRYGFAYLQEGAGGVAGAGHPP